MLEIHAIVVDSFIKEKIKEYREQVERGEVSRQWLDGYTDGAIEYEQLLLENRSKNIIERKIDMTMEEKTNEKHYLTTKEFKRKARSLGFIVLNESTEALYICDLNDKIVASVCRHERYKFSTYYFAFDNISEFNQKNLTNLLVEYASTPIDEREEQERFFLKFKIEIGGKYEYLNYYKEEDVLTLDNSLETSNFQTLFTDKELEKLKEKFGVTLSDFEKIPFKDKEKEECLQQKNL